MSDNAEDRRTEIALFRYTLILPLIRGDYPPGGKERLRQQIASRRHRPTLQRTSAATCLLPLHGPTDEGDFCDVQLNCSLPFCFLHCGYKTQWAGC